MKKVYGVIKFNQNTWLKPYIDMNNKLRQKAKNNFEENFSSWWVMQFLGKLWKSYWTCKDSKQKKLLVAESNYETKKFFTENILTTEMRKTQMLMNKAVYLSLWIFDFSKSVMHEFWYDYVNLKDCENAKLYYMDTNSFMVHVKKQMIFTKTV